MRKKIENLPNSFMSKYDAIRSLAKKNNITLPDDINPWHVILFEMASEDNSYEEKKVYADFFKKLLDDDILPSNEILSEPIFYAGKKVKLTEANLLAFQKQLNNDSEDEFEQSPASRRTATESLSEREQRDTLLRDQIERKKAEAILASRRQNNADAISEFTKHSTSLASSVSDQLRRQYMMQNHHDRLKTSDVASAESSSSGVASTESSSQVESRAQEYRISDLRSQLRERKVSVPSELKYSKEKYLQLLSEEVQKLYPPIGWFLLAIADSELNSYYFKYVLKKNTLPSTEALSRKCHYQKTLSEKCTLQVLAFNCINSNAKAALRILLNLNIYSFPSSIISDNEWLRLALCAVDIFRLFLDKNIYPSGKALSTRHRISSNLTGENIWRIAALNYPDLFERLLRKETPFSEDLIVYRTRENFLHQIPRGYRDIIFAGSADPRLCVPSILNKHSILPETEVICDLTQGGVEELNRRIRSVNHLSEKLSVDRRLAIVATSENPERWSCFYVLIALQTFPFVLQMNIIECLLRKNEFKLIFSALHTPENNYNSQGLFQCKKLFEYGLPLSQRIILKLTKYMQSKKPDVENTFPTFLPHDGSSMTI